MDRTASQQAAMVPDTLDLAEHGRLAVNGMLGSTDPAVDYENYFHTFFDVHPAYMAHYSTQTSGVLVKYVEAMPLLRLMSGSDELREIETGMMAAVVANTAQDGLIYDLDLPNRPWNSAVGWGIRGWHEDYANMGGNGRLLAGFTYYYQATGDPVWREHARRCAERMLELAVVKGDYAYYPNVGCGNDYSYPRKSGWVHTNEPHEQGGGAEGTMIQYLWQPLRGWVRWYRLSGDERFLDLSRRFVAFGMQRKFWGGLNDVEPQAGAERAHFFGHYHGHTCALRGLLDYAVLASDYRTLEFVRDAYEWARHHGIHRLGVFPRADNRTEGCTVADMVSLAVGLTDAGVGDYWEDVDQYARNGLVAAQASDRTEMERVSQAGPERPEGAPWGGHGDTRFQGLGGMLPGQETSERVIERSVGAFGWLIGARYLYSRLMHCCTANGSQGLYYAWEGIVRQQRGRAQVNLWLNRRSPWLDVWSWLPYEGKLLVRNKGLERISIRVPAWVSRAALRCHVDGNPVDAMWMGNRVEFEGLRGNAEICLEAPVPVETTRYTLANLDHRMTCWSPQQYDCEFRGNTVISVGKPEADPSGVELTQYRIFNREHMRASEAPLKAMPLYVHREQVIRW